MQTFMASPPAAQRAAQYFAEMLRRACSAVEQETAEELHRP
jgi:hypothetical protein